MLKKIIVSAGTIGAAGVAMGALGLLGAGAASAAPDVVGMTYGDAVAEIEGGGGTAKIAVTVGDRQDAMGDCLVTNATDAPFMRDAGDGSFGHADGEVLLSLNCNRGVATSTVPGLSAASPAGREFQAKAEEAAAAAQNEQDELAMAGETPGDPEPEIPTG
ncbi:hypothetical protein [Mycolicibacterium sp. 120270]|uniref:hypothetical protein n=1 Tax=Mycolicibacterium sp. 120270 TaxID=3090600 RepID=UPI00299EB5C7|nr:hypothetical protein [Mycolicibacterium sp. 120270]MDX1885679.1 hypothetical protein [Mycolicibacterium sp. 120270]